MSTPCPMRSFSSPSRSPRESASSAAAAAVALPVAGSSERPLEPGWNIRACRSQASRLPDVARIEVDRIAAVLGNVCANAAASGFARRSASREASSITRNGSPTETIRGGCRSAVTSAGSQRDTGRGLPGAQRRQPLERLWRGEFGTDCAALLAQNFHGHQPRLLLEHQPCRRLGGLRRQHEGGADIGMAGERDLRSHGEDANLRVMRRILRRQHEGRLGIVELRVRSPASARSRARRHRAPPRADCRQRRGR